MFDEQPNNPAGQSQPVASPPMPAPQNPPSEAAKMAGRQDVAFKRPEVEDIFGKMASPAAPAGAKPFFPPVPAPKIDSETEEELYGGRSFWQSKWLIIGVVVLILVVAGAIWLIFNMFKNRPAEVKTNQNQNASANVNSSVAQNANGPETAGSEANSAPVQVKDSDSDGLNDEEERGLDTDPNKFDTDNDGLTDGAEVRLYQTDPLNPDTDGDGYRDGMEVINGYDPKKPGSARLYEIPK